MRTKVVPLFVGWYAIASILDAMFWSMTGITFFVGQPGLRVALTLGDALAMLFVYGYMNWDWFMSDKNRALLYYRKEVARELLEQEAKQRLDRDKKSGNGYFWHDPY